jgi:hypothetical protein
MKYLVGVTGVVGALLISGGLAAQSIQTGSPNTGGGTVYSPADKAKMATRPSVDTSVSIEGAATNNQAAVACNLCFTCGGDWPTFSGAASSPTTSPGATERGSSCSGALGPSSDTRPFLCCR